MKNKKTYLVAGFIGATVLAASAKFYMQVQADKADDTATKVIRHFFAQKGQIATVYINQAMSSRDIKRGGVVMTDGRIFEFEYAKGDISYQEVKP